jgi:hypothetical protein
LIAINSNAQNLSHCFHPAATVTALPHQQGAETISAPFDLPT